MKTLLVLNNNETEPTDYAERQTVRAVVVDDKGNTIMYGAFLLGGGIDEGESDEEAVHREVMEEAGIKVEILKPIGEARGYRDIKKIAFIVRGYLCRYIETAGAPTTEQEDEVGREIIWMRPEEAIGRLEAEIESFKSRRDEYDEDGYQSRIYNGQVNLAILREAFMRQN
jgi:8-oxo-dGTP diphosphatase